MIKKEVNVLTFEDLRKGINLTQSELAKLLNVKQSAVSYWESGGDPKNKNLKQLSVVFNQKIDFILECIENSKKRDTAVDYQSTNDISTAQKC